jgi:uncharacterized YccA/Bax inhibitor family protein
MRSTNPVFRRALNGYGGEAAYSYEAATYRGVFFKTLYFILMTIIGAAGGLLAMASNETVFTGMLTFSIFGTMIFSFLAIIFPNLSKVFGTLYCLGEGLLVGVISMYFEALVPGVVFAGLASTIVVLLVVATLFLTNIVKVNGTFIRFLLVFSISVILSQLIIWILSLVGFGTYVPGSSLLISVIMVFLASLYLFFDLDNIRRVVEGGAPNSLEWYVSFGLVFTIVWLYMEVLPLVARILLSGRRS